MLNIWKTLEQAIYVLKLTSTFWFIKCCRVPLDNQFNLHCVSDKSLVNLICALLWWSVQKGFGNRHTFSQKKKSSNQTFLLDSNTCWSRLRYNSRIWSLFWCRIVFCQHLASRYFGKNLRANALLWCHGEVKKRSIHFFHKSRKIRLETQLELFWNPEKICFLSKKILIWYSYKKAIGDRKFPILSKKLPHLSLKEKKPRRERVNNAQKY